MCFKSKSREALNREYMSLEPFIKGTYVKYNNNNNGYVNKDNLDNPFNQTAQAFSHFTFERSRGGFLVSDLQGIGNVLMDPAIHTLNPKQFKLADTSLNKDGFKFFFASHVCNSICRKLRLVSNVSMITSDKYEFRESWPSMGNLVCCSSKLCNKLMHLANAKKPDDFRGHYWCDMCWPQLQSSIVKFICVAPGPHHKFDVSKFFYESRGLITPCKCPEHRKEDVTVSKTAAVAGNHRDMPKIARKVISFFSKSR